MAILRSLFGFDVRSIALFRVVLAFVLLWDLLTEFRVVPSGQGWIWALTLSANFLFLIGFQVFWVSPVLALLLVLLDMPLSIPAVYFLGCALLPVGAFYSWDRAFDSREEHQFPKVFLSFATLAILFSVDYPVSYWMLIAWMPSAFWDRWVASLKTPSRIGLRLYYDRECSACRKLISLLKTFFLFPEVEIRAAQEFPEMHAIMERESSWVVQDVQGQLHLRFQGVLVILRASPVAFWLAPILSIPWVAHWGDRLYRWFAQHGRRRVSPLLPATGPKRLYYGEGWLGQLLGLLYLGLVAWLSWIAIQRMISDGVLLLSAPL